MCHNIDNGPQDLMTRLFHIQNLNNVSGLPGNTWMHRAHKSPLKTMVLKIRYVISFSLLGELYQKQGVDAKGKIFLYKDLTKIVYLSILIVRLTEHKD